jgi:PAS domain S-box-containing protein
VLITDEQNRIVFHNTGFTRMLGFQSQQTIGKLPRELFASHPTFVKSIERCHGELLQGHSFHTEELIYDLHEQPVWISAVVNPIMDPTGKLINAVCVMTDITNTKVHEVLQYRVLNAMARDSSLGEQMNLLCEEVERVAPEVIASMLRVDEQGLHTLAAPGLPEAYTPRHRGHTDRPAGGLLRQRRLHRPERSRRTSPPIRIGPTTGTGLEPRPACLLVDADQVGRRQGHRHLRFLLSPAAPAQRFHHLLVDAGLHLCAWPSSVKPRARASINWPSMIR